MSMQGPSPSHGSAAPDNGDPAHWQMQQRSHVGPVDDLDLQVQEQKMAAEAAMQQVKAFLTCHTLAFRCGMVTF